MAEESNKQISGIEPSHSDEVRADEAEAATLPGWREVLREAFDKARREQQPASRRELGRDRSRGFFLLAGAAIAVLLLLLGVFSSSNTKKTGNARRAGAPNLGRSVTPGQQRGGLTGSVTPLLNVQTGQTAVAPNADITPEDIGRTARPAQPFAPSRPAATKPVNQGPYALGRIDFSEAAPRQEVTAPAPSSTQTANGDLRKPSLVFVRSAQRNTANSSLKPAPPFVEETPKTLNLPAGTRLMARLQAVVSSAVKTPVVAAIEYNYERDGEIVVPAGTHVLGRLRQADRSGYVAIHFDSIQMPDGSTEKIDATAMSLSFGPLKGVVSGKRTGTNFLIRAFSGIGQAASYIVGSNGINAPLSQGALLRDQIATNIGIAGDQQLNSLAFNPNIVVSIPGNTRFYVVVEKGTNTIGEQAQSAGAQRASTQSPPTAEELRQLLQLRQELSALYQQADLQNAAPQARPR